jgi:hypothetical protein
MPLPRRVGQRAREPWPRRRLKRPGEQIDPSSPAGHPRPVALRVRVSMEATTARFWPGSPRKSPKFSDVDIPSSVNYISRLTTEGVVGQGHASTIASDRLVCACN